jgi:hypothetical protein
MDRAVLDAYGWKDLWPVCDFIPEFEEEEPEGESARSDKRYRYRWPDEIRDEVLARLLALNQERYQEEALAGLHDRSDGSRLTRCRKSGDEEELSDDQGELEL